MIQLTNLAPKPRKHRGRVISHEPIGELHADVERNVSIRLFGRVTSSQQRNEAGEWSPMTVAFDRTFKLGDEAEYDSFNLVYTGQIVAITDKIVTIQDGSERHRLDLYEFIRRNWDLDLEKIGKNNQDVLTTC